MVDEAKETEATVWPRGQSRLAIADQNRQHLRRTAGGSKIQGEIVRDCSTVTGLSGAVRFDQREPEPRAHVRECEPSQ